MIRSNFTITQSDTKILRHEKVIDWEDSAHARLQRRNKNKKIIVTLTAHQSDIANDKDTETMDLSKKDQESSQLCRVMYQKASKEDGV